MRSGEGERGKYKRALMSRIEGTLASFPLQYHLDKSATISQFVLRRLLDFMASAPLELDHVSSGRLDQRLFRTRVCQTRRKDDLWRGG